MFFYTINSELLFYFFLKNALKSPLKINHVLKPQVKETSLNRFWVLWSSTVQHRG